MKYLKEDLAANVGDRSDRAFIHNVYAILTACRILYSAQYRTLASKDQAYAWATKMVPSVWRAILRAAKDNRLKNHGSTTTELENDAMCFVDYVTREVKRELMRSI